jgi:uncharacterized protein YbjT (DUF2867 family)
MNILLTGSTGFIGRRLLAEFLKAGHHVRCAVRRLPTQAAGKRKDRAAAALAPAGRIAPKGGALHERAPISVAQDVAVSYVVVDYNKAVTPAGWADAVAGVDTVVNAVGILRETRTQRFDVIHRAAPCALFGAAAQARVKHIVQISALGADPAAQSRYHLSKKAADDFLGGLPIASTVVQPSLVYGPGGTSATLFGMMASLPLTPLPGRGDQQIQPVHIDDLAAAVLTIVSLGHRAPERIALVGGRALSLREFYATLRSSMGLSGAAHFVPVPMPIMRLTAAVGNRLPGGMLDTETLNMLVRGNTASANDITALLGHRPRSPEDFIPPAYGRAAGTRAKLQWLLPALRISIGLVWIFTGIVSLGLYPVEASYALLARTGTPPALMPLLLYGAALLDLLLGVLTLSPWRSRWLWLVQAVLVLGYMAIISWKLPEFWLHPYGPVLKNLPFLVGLWILYELEDRAWTT